MEDITAHANSCATQAPSASHPTMEPLERQSSAPAVLLESLKYPGYTKLQPMLCRSDTLLETYEKLSGALYTLHRQKGILTKDTRCGYTVDAFFQCISRLCDLLETTIASAMDIIHGAGHVTHDGIFKLALMGVSTSLDIYECLLRSINPADDGEVDCPQSPQAGISSWGSVQLPWLPGQMETDTTIFRPRVMDGHFKRLKFHSRSIS
ncbi:hypothetical protein BDV28DRAFT_128086 [Aspergillus coremiiformis]|uniref:Uncharacterized protein n=1 Tax=Aspergillus coremiiformis TaxID=138285 RepID=A0A5N6ZG60_9EURO|nr:hypothetical protein BDV28DRAFT_128086 [Aspergillus coremiiformis]